MSIEEDPEYIKWCLQRECAIHGDVQVVEPDETPEPMPSMLGYGWEEYEDLSCGCRVYYGPDPT